MEWRLWDTASFRSFNFLGRSACTMRMPRESCHPGIGPDMMGGHKRLAEEARLG